ncbi:OmpA-like transmembrane domain-containing protein [Thiohalomonas denitrificans]|uniref:OmpA-like transmembrane domain-containing protein n=2 Tax=Thiohalomonas denitrificans TaxID=415747 RepID=A0A1G5QSR0_9GAMM|nr:OmpA-like transmembrane domain-containing protein [Thiohalomonas denitrificans]
MRKLLMVVGFVAATAAGGASAQGYSDGFYLGGGFGNNSLSGFDDATGFQVFAGFPLAASLGQASTAIEVGYMDSGDFDYCVPSFAGELCGSTDAAGLWATGVADYALGPQLSALGRLGLDFGDDDGLMFGVGLGYDVTTELEVRGEYVVRDNIDSLQLNFVFRP